MCYKYNLDSGASNEGAPGGSSECTTNISSAGKRLLAGHLPTYGKLAVIYQHMPKYFLLQKTYLSSSFVLLAY